MPLAGIELAPLHRETRHITIPAKFMVHIMHFLIGKSIMTVNLIDNHDNYHNNKLKKK